MIRISNLNKTYESQTVLANFSLSLPDHGIVCLFGRSGCGKTTLLRILAGLVAPDSGTITGLEHKRISMVFQEDRLLPWLTVAGNVGIVQPEASVVQYYLRSLQLSDKSRQFPAALSGGMRRRVALARALAYGGDLFILDEPLKGLDKGLKEAIYPHLRDLRQNSLVLMTTHDEGEIAALADQTFYVTGPPLTIQLNP